MDDEITIPYKFTPREYQLPFLRAIEKAIAGEIPQRFFYLVWHRRAGKDKTIIADPVPRMLLKEPLLVKYVYPTLVMGRDILWDGIDSQGMKFLNHIPEEMRDGTPDKTRMKMPIIGGSMFQVAGSEDPDSLRGGNPKLTIYSEWADQNPDAWNVVEPILRENKGIAIFNTTPKGDNHARALLEYAKDNPDLWWLQTLTAEDTKIFTKDELKKIQEDIVRRFVANGQSEDEAVAYYEQEYMCSFESPVVGSYYGAAITRAEKEGRITSVPVQESVMVDTYWDLGIDDSMTIWFVQTIGQEIHFVDYYESSGEGLVHYASKLQEKKYIFGKHYAPHDIAVRELGTGKSRLETAKSLGIVFEVAPKLSIEDGINACRSIFSQCWFDKDKCYKGLQALKNYKKDWDENNKVFRNNPLHNWASHGADAFRTFGNAYKKYKLPTTFPAPTGGIKPYFERFPA